MSTIYLDGSRLGLADVIAVAHKQAVVQLTEQARSVIHKGSEQVRKLVDTNKAIYGVNTGFGLFSNRTIEPEDREQLSYNLILSHAAGTGEPVAEEIVRAAILIRANSLTNGNSGVRLEIIESLLALLNKGVFPYVPTMGSLGSSGDLAPLAHMALVVTRPDHAEIDRASGRAWFENELLDASEAMKRAGIDQIAPGPKEGLALINGTAFTTAYLVAAISNVKKVINAGLLAACMSLEALQANSNPFDERLHRARPHPGQIEIADRMRSLIAGSTLINSLDHVQDSYSLRCIPQVIGPVIECLEFVEGIVLRELNASTDNPLIFEDQSLSGGNFHGENLALAADYLKIAMAEFGAISERRVYRLVSPHDNVGLPAMLVRSKEVEGIQSGFMVAQYTSASMVLETRSLAAPDSIQSLPTSGGQEDVNANASTAARRLYSEVELLRYIVAIELVTAAQAIDLRLQQYPLLIVGSAAEEGLVRVREQVPFMERDTSLHLHFEQIVERIDKGEFDPDTF